MQELRAALQRAGIDVDAEEARRALVLLPKWEGHLKGGSFAHDKVITMMHAAVNDALSAGFKGLCAAWDMSWPLHEGPDSERLAEYEAHLNHFYKAQRALGLCQYNHSKLPPATIDHESLPIASFEWSGRFCWRIPSTKNPNSPPSASLSFVRSLEKRATFDAKGTFVACIQSI